MSTAVAGTFERRRAKNRRGRLDHPELTRVLRYASGRVQVDDPLVAVSAVGAPSSDSPN